MHTDKSKKQLIEEIEEKRKILNRLILEDMSREKILKLSKELDTLIGEYYKSENK